MLRKTILSVVFAVLLIGLATMLLNVQLVRMVHCDSDVDYIGYEQYGGTWADAEKTLDNTEDDDMCWAAAACNILEWTGWGLVGGMWNTDEMFSYCQDYWDDTGGFPYYIWHWWFDGTGADHPGGGNFWPAYTWTDYYHSEGSDSQVLTAIDDWLHAGYGVTFGIYDGAHRITCWGFRYDDSVDKAAHPEDYYLGVWVTDSDNDKNWVGPAEDAPNTLVYRPVLWDGSVWRIDSAGGWMIDNVQALEPFPNNRPVADADGPYEGYEGSAVTFDASGSSDADGDSLQYRWDFDDDGAWDTAWSTGATASNTWLDDYSGTVVLQVYDGHMLDVDTATVTVHNVAPTVDAGPDQTSDEGDMVSFSGSFSDPGADTHTLSWDFGDGSATSGTLTPTHTYGDDGVYTVTLTVTDDEGDAGVGTLTVTVSNVPPSITPLGPFTVDEGTQLTLTATSTDPGSDDLTFTWEFQLGPVASTVYYNDGVAPDPYPSPDGTYPFPATDTVQHTYGDDGVYTVTLTVTDDDGGLCVYDTTVTVNNVAPSISDLAMASPNPENPEFVLPTVHEPLFTGSATDPGSDDLTFTWSWGDTTDETTIYYNDGVAPDPYPSPDGTYPFSATDDAGHVYALPGTYTVTLTVEDDDGGVDAATYEVTVLSAEEAKEVIGDYIQSLGDDAFRGNAPQRRKAFNKMFSAVDDMLADEEYWGAATDLFHNVREKADGTVDGSPNNDWITDATAQEHICWKIDALTAYLETLVV